MNEKEKLTALLVEALSLEDSDAMADYLLAHGVIVPQDNADLVNVNTATVKELMGVPGIGSTLAGRIHTLRHWRGPYLSLDDLAFVPGMGKSRLEHIKDKICI